MLLFGIMIAGVAAALYRLAVGLQGSTNLSNDFPWGIWIAYDVESRVALAAGGFTTAALAHIFQRHKFEPIVRGALLTAMLGYTCAVTGLLLDLGRYYNVWHPMLPSMWQGNSVLFEVAMCVMAYLTVLYIEFSPAFFERFVGRVNLPGPLARLDAPAENLLRIGKAIIGKTLFLFMIGGVVLSCMHQSALGSLILVAPYKTSALWFTPILPMLFLISAIACGFPMVIFESIYASWSFGRKPPMHLLIPLAKMAVVLLGIYAFAKISDLVIREQYMNLALNLNTVMLLIEIAIGIVIPLFMLTRDRVRRSPGLLFTASCFIIAGIIMNRVNIFLIAYRPPYMTKAYVPSVAEVLVSLGLTAGMIFMYRLIVTIFPILSLASQPEKAPQSAPALDAAHE
jgi:Ni/Fe-hydrogenase subunit HybB-like protein